MEFEVAFRVVLVVGWWWWWSKATDESMPSERRNRQQRHQPAAAPALSSRATAPSNKNNKNNNNNDDDDGRSKTVLLWNDTHLYCYTSNWKFTRIKTALTFSRSLSLCHPIHAFTRPNVPHTKLYTLALALALTLALVHSIQTTSKYFPNFPSREWLCLCALCVYTYCVSLLSLKNNNTVREFQDRTIVIIIIKLSVCASYVAHTLNTRTHRETHTQTQTPLSGWIARATTHTQNPPHRHTDTQWHAHTMRLTRKHGWNEMNEQRRRRTKKNERNVEWIDVRHTLYC